MGYQGYRKLLLLAALAIYLSFYLPLGVNSPWSKFFPPGYIHHGYRGLDFYQLPEGARSLLNGKSISGEDLGASLSFTEGEVTNRNVYHPALTLSLGAFVQLFEKKKAEFVWHTLKLLTSLGVVLYLLRKYRDSRYRLFASCLFFLNLAHFSEIQILQYQSLANVFLLLFLYASSKGKRTLGVLSMTLSLIVKPFFIIGILIQGARDRDWRFAASVGSWMALLTLPFLLWEPTRFFFDNLKDRALHSVIPIQPDILSLQSALSMYGVTEGILKMAQWSSLILLLLLSIDRRSSLPTLTLLALLVWLSFDLLIYEYHFSTIASVLFFGVLTEQSWQRKPALVLSALATLPSPYFLLRALEVGMTPNADMLLEVWAPSVILRFSILLALVGYLLYVEVTTASVEEKTRLSFGVFDKGFEFFWGAEDHDALLQARYNRASSSQYHFPSYWKGTGATHRVNETWRDADVYFCEEAC